MDVTASATKRRRRPLVLITLTMSVLAAVLVGVRHGPTYSVDASVLLLPPAAPAQADGGADDNPLFYLGSLNPVRDLLLETLTADDTRRLIADEHPGTGYTVKPDALASAPVAVLTAKAPATAQAEAVLDDLIRLLPQSLAQIQERTDVPPDGLVTARLATRAAQPDVSHVDQVRAGLLAGTLVLAMCLVCATLAKTTYALWPHRSAEDRSEGPRRSESLSASHH